MDGDEVEDLWRARRKFDQREIDQEALFKADYCNGNNEVAKNINRKSALSLEKSRFIAFRLCGHQSICEYFYQNKSDVDLLNCVIYKTLFFKKLFF